MVDEQGLLALQRSLEQAAVVLGTVAPDDLARPTPCEAWDVRALSNHMLASVRTFVTMLQGSPPGWHVPEDYDAGFEAEMRTRGNVLVNLWREIGDGAMGNPDIQAAEFAIHAWDLTVALGADSAALDEPLAQRALVTLDANLGTERRGNAFGPARSAPAGSDASTHLAAYAGRNVVDAPH